MFVILVVSLGIFVCILCHLEEKQIGFISVRFKQFHAIMIISRLRAYCQSKQSWNKNAYGFVD